MASKRKNLKEAYKKRKVVPIVSEEQRARIYENMQL